MKENDVPGSVFPMTKEDVEATTLNEAVIDLSDSELAKNGRIQRRLLDKAPTGNKLY